MMVNSNPSRKTISAKKALIEKWKTATVGMKVFCAEHEISLSALKYWMRQFGVPSKRQGKKKVFIPLSVVPDGQNKMLPAVLFAEIVFTNGTRLSFHQPVSASFLKAII